MTFETTMAGVLPVAAGLSLLHAFASRSRWDALFLSVTAVVFGYAFPYVDVNVFHHYGFTGDLTVAGLPFHLGFTWFSFYYLALVTAERALGGAASTARLALLTGALFGILEVQWDLTLAEAGMIHFAVPSFATWPHGLHPGIPMFHAYLAVNWVLAWRLLGRARSPALGLGVACACLVAFPLSVMAGVPFTGPVIEALSPRLSPGWQVFADFFHFSTTFIPVGLVAAWVFRALGRRLAPGGA